MLMRRWDRARQADGQLVLVIGEPGLGKSRLMRNFMPACATHRTPGSSGVASQLLQNTPLHPVAEWGRRRFGSADVSADSDSRTWKIRWPRSNSTHENVRVACALFGIPLPAERTMVLAPEEFDVGNWRR